MIIRPNTILTATYLPPRPAAGLLTRIPPSHAIPWIGSRNRWVAEYPPSWLNHPDDMLFVLTAGTDGFAVLEGKPLHAPDLLVGRRVLHGVVVDGVAVDGEGGMA